MSAKITSFQKEEENRRSSNLSNYNLGLCLIIRTRYNNFASIPMIAVGNGDNKMTMSEND